MQRSLKKKLKATESLLLLIMLQLKLLDLRRRNPRQ